MIRTVHVHNNYSEINDLRKPSLTSGTMLFHGKATDRFFLNCQLNPILFHFEQYPPQFFLVRKLFTA